MVIYSIVITYNGEKWIEKCLDSLTNSSIISKVLVVDNNSTDKTKDIIKAKFPQVQLIESDRNLGFGRANNIGLKVALENHSDFVFLLNQDAWLETETLENLVNISKQNPEYGIISPVALNGAGNKLDFGFERYIKDFQDTLLLSDLFLSKTKAIYKISFVNASGWLITRNCLQKVGGFDNLFNHYGEDVDYCQRVYHKGFHVGITPRSFYFHDRTEKDSVIYENNLKYKLTAYFVDLKDLSKEYRSKFIATEITLARGFFVNCIKLSFRNSFSNLKLSFWLLNKYKQIENSRLISKEDRAFL